MLKQTTKSKVLFLLLGILFFELFVLPLASATVNVAYIINNPNKVRAEVLDVFSEMNLNVTIIKDSKAKTFNLSKFDMVFVDNSRLPVTKNLPIYNYPSVVMNKYYNSQWGLTDNDGSSQMSSTYPLEVMVPSTSSIEQVYTTSKPSSGGGANLAYYFLDDLNKAPVIESIARTFRGYESQDNPTLTYGDVVGAIKKGTVLRNGKTSGGKMCFFGIMESKYWTQSGRDLFIDCVNSVLIECKTNAECNDQNSNTEDICHYPNTVDSYCTNDPIKCFIDSDCGTNTNTSNFCMADNVVKNSTTFTCHNKGTGSSYCTNATTSILNQTCNFGCSAGACLLSQCSDTINNDFLEDVLVDAADPGCHSDGDETNLSTYDPNDNNETDPFIRCHLNSDCGANGLVNGLFCTGKNVTQNYLTFTCNNPGTIFSTCTNATSLIINETCSVGCNNGSCILPVHNVGFKPNYDGFNNFIKINNPANNALNDPVVINEKVGGYDIGFKTINKGDYNESVQLICNITDESLNLIYNWSNNFALASSLETTTGNKDNFNFANFTNGIYNLSCFLNIAIDNNLSDNYASRILFVNFSIPAQCSDTLDNDVDGLIDIFDPGCHNDFNASNNLSYNPNDNNETNILPCMDADGDSYDVCNPGELGDDGKPADCNDNNFNIHPDALEICNFIDDDCDGLIDDGINCNIICFNNSQCNDANPLTYDQCVNAGTVASYCRHTEINCASNDDCGVNGLFGAEYCFSDDIFKNRQNATCFNAGTLESYCQLQVTPSLLNECDYACYNATCIRCDENLDCNDGNLLTTDICLNPGTLNSYCNNQQPFPICGNSIIELGEQCDDGNHINHDGCSATCQIESIACYNNSQCGIDGFSSSNYCSGSNILQNYTTYTCNNAGTSLSYCSNLVVPLFNSSCTYGCSNGICLNPTCTDADHDGYNAASIYDCGVIDCNDNNAAIHPNAQEVCNNIDDDCDGLIDDGIVCECFANSDCNDNLYCNGIETCNLVSHTCQSGTSISCSANNILAISTCNNNPDNNPFTFDSRSAFISSCNEATDSCTIGISTINHACSISSCGAECVYNSHCAKTECDNLDGCHGTSYYDYSDVNNNCLNNCNCENNACSNPVITPNDARCVVELECGKIKATYYNLRKNVETKPNCPEDDWYYYDLNITETTGDANVTLDRRIRTWLNGDVDGPYYDPISKFGTNVVMPGKTITAKNRWFCTDFHPDRMTETWYGETLGADCNVVTASFSINTA